MPYRSSSRRRMRSKRQRRSHTGRRSRPRGKRKSHSESSRNRCSAVRYRAAADDRFTVRVSPTCPVELSHEFEKIDAWISHWQEKARTRPPTFGDTTKSFLITHTVDTNSITFELKINVSTHRDRTPEQYDDDGCQILQPELSYSWFCNGKLGGQTLLTSTCYRNIFVATILHTTRQLIKNGYTTLTLDPPVEFRRSQAFSGWVVVT